MLFDKAIGHVLSVEKKAQQLAWTFEDNKASPLNGFVCYLGAVLFSCDTVTRICEWMNGWKLSGVNLADILPRPKKNIE